MLKKTKTISITGSSLVTVDGSEKTVMTMNASINEAGTVSCGKYIQDKELYTKHKEEAVADYQEFEEYVDGLMEV